MAKDIEKYINELKEFLIAGKDMDIYSLKRELNDLSESKVFENFEKESMIIDKGLLSQIEDLSLLLKIKNLASKIKDKNEINNKLHSLHFKLNLFRNSLIINDTKSIKNILDVFLYNNDSKIDTIINELNDFKAKIDEVKKHQQKLLSKSLDNKLEIENKYNKHIEQLHLIHKKQKNILVSLTRLFLELTKNHIKTYKNLNKKS